MTSNRSIPQPAELQRLSYSQGQMLRSRDFRDQMSFAAQLRWWHNRALHNTFGVVTGGLQVTLKPDGKSVSVEPGLAYDCFGRELMLFHRQSVAIPEMTQSITLLARYKDTPLFAENHDLAGACLPGTASLSEEQPDLFWKVSRTVQIRDGVPLAQLAYESSVKLDTFPQGITIPDPLNTRIRYDTDQKLLIYKGVMTDAEKDALLRLSADEAFQEAIKALFEMTRDLKRNLAPTVARPLARPRIGNGTTISGGTHWEIWDLSSLGLVGLQVRIDTSAVGFTEVPCYFAWLYWPHLDLSPFQQQSLPSQLFLSGFQYVEETSINGFVFRCFPIESIGASGPNPIEQELLGFAQEQQFSVCWLGIQLEPGQGAESNDKGVSHGHLG